MVAGKLKHQIAFDKRTEPIDDGFGNVVNGWSEQFKVWAGKRYLTGGESVLASRLSGHQPVIVTVRRSDLTVQITTAWRCRDIITEEAFNIRSVTPAENREAYIDLLVEAGVAEG